MNTEMAKPPTPPRRIWIFFASEAPVAVILKRGPTDWVQLVKWDVRTDQFEAGQWMKARVDERTFDLSPDGKLIVYWARANTKRDLQEWTAVSKPPYFTALALWPWRGSYFGGGFFESSTHLWISSGGWEIKLHPDFVPCPLAVNTAWAELASPLRAVSYRRWLRRGWRRLQSDDQPVEPESSKPQASRRGLRQTPTNHQPWVIWEWQSPKGETIRSLSYHGVPYLHPKDTLFYHCLPNGEERLIDYPVLDWDQRGRMVRVADGKLFVAELQDDNLVEQELIDLNGATPAAQKAPLWATTWD